MEIDLRQTFSLPTLEEWLALARAELKGADPLAALARPTAEGLSVGPLYTPDQVPGVPALAGRGGSPWMVRQEIRLSDPAAARREALEALGSGADAVDFRLDAGTRRRRIPAAAGPEGGVRLLGAADLEALLEGLEGPIFLHAGSAALPVAAALRASGIRGLRGGLGLDPLGALAAGDPMPIDALYDEAARLVGEEPGLRVLTVAARPYHEAGASVYQELAFSLATGLEYARALTKRGVDLQAALDTFEFTFALSARIFPEVARLRAARLLWDRIVSLLGGRPGMFIHGRTDRYSQSALDPSTNLVRTAVAAFLGAVGGCDSLTVNPMDVVRGVTSPASRRWARNQQLLLLEEASLHRVDDPGAGSYYLETLTEEVARRAWETFQRIEAAGGMRQALAEGLPQAMVGETARARADRAARGRVGMVGVTRYVVPPMALPEAEAPSGGPGPGPEISASGYEEAVRALASGASLEAVGRALVRGAEVVAVPPLPIGRLAAPFEELQLRAAAAGPRALLAVVGAPKMGRIRADFCASLLASGGFHTETASFDSVEEAARRAREEGFGVVVACAEDGEYGSLVPGLVSALRAGGGKALLAVAGLPPDAAELEGLGVQVFLHRDSHRPQVLGDLLDRLGIPPVEGAPA